MGGGNGVLGRGNGCVYINGGGNGLMGRGNGGGNMHEGMEMGEWVK